MGLLKVLSSAISVVMILCFTVGLYAGAALTITSDAGFYLSEFEKVGTFANFREKAEPARLAQDLTAYFRDGSNWPPEISGFDLPESLHLRDVKLIILKLRAAFYFCSFLLASCIIFMIVFYRGSLLRNLPNLLLWAGASVLFVALVFSLLALSFSASFALFHKTFFSQGNWQFPTDSTLIRLFPQQFFLDSFLTILFRAGFFGLLLLSLGLTLRHIKKNQKGL
jgi:integral membrane protein (TIGR01906 family)